MELTKVEVEALKEVVAKAEQNEIRPLEDLQLVLIGGGIGDVAWG